MFWHILHIFSGSTQHHWLFWRASFTFKKINSIIGYAYCQKHYRVFWEFVQDHQPKVIVSENSISKFKHPKYINKINQHLTHKNICEKFFKTICSWNGWIYNNLWLFFFIKFGSGCLQRGEWNCLKLFVECCLSLWTFSHQNYLVYVYFFNPLIISKITLPRNIIWNQLLREQKNHCYFKDFRRNMSLSWRANETIKCWYPKAFKCLDRKQKTYFTWRSLLGFIEFDCLWKTWINLEWFNMWKDV